MKSRLRVKWKGIALSIRIGLAVLLLLPTLPVKAEPEIHSLTGVMEGHEVGGVSIDLVGNIYAADFGDIVWKITPEGLRTPFATGIYGAAGNAIDPQGHLLQANYYANLITRTDRNGRTTPFVTQGLDRPTGIAVDKRTGQVFIANCRSNNVVKVAADGTVTPFATSPLFKCPYGLSFDRDGNLYSVNFEDNRMVKIDGEGRASLFATVSAKGLGHLCFKRDRFYVTAFSAHEIYQVMLDGKVERILGTGERGAVDGGPKTARISFPSGIGCHPWAPRLYVAEDINESGNVVPRRSTVRVITLNE